MGVGVAEGASWSALASLAATSGVSWPLHMVCALTIAKIALVALFLTALAGAGFAAKRTGIADGLRDANGTLIAAAVVASTLAWCAFLLIMITRGATWPYPNDYFATVPDFIVSQVLKHLWEDETCHVVTSTREEEGLGMLSGAYIAGKRGASIR